MGTTPIGRRISKGRWYLGIAVILLLAAAFFRLWRLDTTPPGLLDEELTNAQISDWMRQGEVSVIYDEVSPAREGLYYALLAFSTTLTGRGLMLWRLPSVWMAMLSLAMTARLMRRQFGARVALMAVGLMSVTFWPVWMGRAVLHVTLMPLVTTFVFYTFSRAYQARELTDSSLWFTVGGLALGMAQYIHVTAWTLVVILLVFFAYRQIVDPHEMRRHWGNVFYALGLAAILNLPLFVFLARHPGVREPVPLAEQASLITEIPERVISSLAGLALRGDMLPAHNLPGRPVFGPIIAILMVIGIGVALPRLRFPSYGFALLWLALGLIPTAFLPRKPDFEFMAVILPVVFVFPAVGMQMIYRFIRQRLRDRVRRWGMSAVSALVVFMVVGNALWTYRDYFLVWPALDGVRQSYQSDVGVLAHYLDTNDDPTPVSICTTPVNRRDHPFALTNQELLSRYLMHRRNLPIRYFDCTQSLVLASAGESQRLIFPRGHYYDRLPGSLLAWMRYAHDEGVPGIGPDIVMRLDVSRELADYAGALITTAPTALPPESGESRLVDLPVSFGENVTFLGYVVRDSTVRATDWVELTTYWRLDGPPPSELTLFTHLLGNPVVVIAQDDGLGVQIATLQPRDIFLQYSMIQTPGAMIPGLYPLSVGLYYPGSGMRLSVFENGEAHATRLFLQRIEVSP